MLASKFLTVYHLILQVFGMKKAKFKTAFRKQTLFTLFMKF